jgi:hypothetical protein
MIQARPGVKREFFPKITKAERTGSVAQVVEHLCSKPRALSLTPHNAKKKKKKKAQNAAHIKYFKWKNINEL